MLCAQAVLVLVAFPAAVGAADPLPGIEALSRLDRLAFGPGAVRVGSISSYDRSGGNDDGFSGKYSFLRKEDGGLVIADLAGPGMIARIWTPTPTDDIVEFFFDGEDAPRIRVPFRQIFLGTHWPFVAPLSGYGAGGFCSYVPLPFRKACKVVVRAERVQFYQIHYAIYAEGTPIETFAPEPSPVYRAAEARARALFGAPGSDLSDAALPPGAPREIVRWSGTLANGTTATVLETSKPGRIAGIRIAPASALAGKARDLLLRMTWDDASAPAVLCPAGDFFGFAWGAPATRSLLAGTAGDTCYSYFPMPFDRSASIELVSERTSGSAPDLRVEIVLSSVGRRPDEGRFHAIWRRENPTTKGVPFTFVETEGEGHLVGCILQAQGMKSGNTYFFEGDDQTTIDGELVIHGTGSEDFFNGGWYDVPGRWEKRLSFPLSGCIGYQKHLGRTGGYRFMFLDAFSFEKSIRQTIEHAPTGNDLLTDYCAVTFLYLREGLPGGASVPPAAARQVVDLERIVFAAGWNIPIHAFTFQGGTVAKRGEKIGGADVRYLSHRAEGRDWFGDPFISLVVDLPAPGEYAVSVDAIKGPAQGTVGLYRNEAPVGDAVDFYAEAREMEPAVRLGTVALDAGPNDLMFKLVGKNPKSSGLGFDIVHIICERVK
ncbi:MAG: DUF2961 domain-containing protein [Planctomycetes bacterium]|nr:DUF2961 domain-containing protein [Planctomycetota bacterium]